MSNRVLEIIKQKNNPEQYAKEQQYAAEKQKEITEMLAFVDGVLAGIDQQEAHQEEIRKAGIMFVSDPVDPKGFRPKGFPLTKGSLPRKGK